MRVSALLLGLVSSAHLACGGAQVPQHEHDRAVAELKQVTESRDAARAEVTALRAQLSRLRQTDCGRWDTILEFHQKGQWLSVIHDIDELLKHVPRTQYARQARSLRREAVAAQATNAPPPRPIPTARTESPRSDGASPNRSESSLDPPYYVKLAILDAASSSPPQQTIEAMRRHTAELERLCPDTPEHIGDMLVATQRQIRSRGKNTSLLQLAADVAHMLGEAERSGGIPAMSTCAEPMALWVLAKP